MSARRPIETLGAGLEPLAVLPVFLQLRGRRAVVAGGDVGALWKARLLSAAGAEVDVFAPDIDPALSPEPVDGPIRLHARDWCPEDLDGAAFAIAALEEVDACAALMAEARRRGVPANAVDKPHLCDIQFGAVVNRSPLVIGVSTAGAAPILAQRVRSEIEALFPRGLAGWLATAARWRERVGSAFAPGADRRRFWERFTDRAFREAGREPRPDEMETLMAEARSGKPERTGSVLLVGAGPGDPELLTLKAIRALRSADIVLYDDLVAAEILAFARREARTMLVGKTGHGPSCRQGEINGLMVSLARQGRRVVRLKGGDPLIFARAAEELEACRAAGIPVEIVPGISAAQGAAASLAIPLTERRTARRLQFVTAHDMTGSLPGLDWGALADPDVTTAIYMPRRRCTELLERLASAGLNAATPAVAVVDATRPGQASVSSSLEDLPAAMAALPEAGPMILMIGEALRGVRSAGVPAGADHAVAAAAAR